MSKYRRTTTLVTTPPPEHCLSDTSEGFHHHHHQQTQMNNEVIAKRNDTIPRIPVCTRPMFFCSHTGLGSENRSASRSKPDLDRSEYCASLTTCIRPPLYACHAMHACDCLLKGRVWRPTTFLTRLCLSTRGLHADSMLYPGGQPAHACSKLPLHRERGWPCT
jgi:hypothetical protein